MKVYGGGVDVQIHIFLTSTLVGGEWSVSRPGCFIPGERAPGTHLIRRWVGPRADLDDIEKRKFLTLPGLELRPLGNPARSQSLHRLCYPGSLLTTCSLKVNRRFGRTYRLHLQDWRMNLARNQHESMWQAESGVMFLRNVGWISADYTGL
jgi:hypothetical protein